MPSPRAPARLRQAVLAANRLEPVASALRRELGLGEPFQDPGVGLFGLRNAVFALGDCFLEVVSPERADTAAARHLARRGGDCGYMVMFDLRDYERARARAQALGIRTVWEIELPDIADAHLHPADMRGAIVALDRSRPRGSWRWGGPEWAGRIGTGAPGRLAGITLAVPDPAAAAERWGHVLGAELRVGEQPALLLDAGEVSFIATSGTQAEGLCEVAVELPGRRAQPDSVTEIGGVRFRLLAAGGPTR